MYSTSLFISLQCIGLFDTDKLFNPFINILLTSRGRGFNHEEVEMLRQALMEADYAEDGINGINDLLSRINMLSSEVAGGTETIIGYIERDADNHPLFIEWIEEMEKECVGATDSEHADSEEDW